MAVFFILPFLLLKIFQTKYSGGISALDIKGWEFIQRLLSPNLDMLQRVVSNIARDASRLYYYFLIAVIFSWFQPKQWSYAWPVALWLGLLTIYYAYIYVYGSVGAGDAGSGLRYFLPAAAGFFIIGANGFSNVIDFTKKRSNQLFRSFLYLILLAVILWKIF
jgi:hypothetical protein